MAFCQRTVDGYPGHVYLIAPAREAHPVRIKAWDLIGFDGSAESINCDDQLQALIGPQRCHVRIAGGRTLYEAVYFHDSTPGDKVQLARLDTRGPGLHAVVRGVDPDTELELVVTSC
jgi:hypothetical protein